MKIVLLALLALLLAGCGGNTIGNSTFATLDVFLQTPTNNTGSIAIETTKPSDPAFMMRGYYPLPSAPTREFTMDFDKGSVYVVTMKLYDQEDGTGNVLQTVSRQVDFTTESRLEMAFQFD